MKLNLQTIRNNFNIGSKNSSVNNSVRTSSFLTPPFALKEDKFQFARENNELSFLGVQCATKSFRIKGIENLTCPACAKIMLNSEQIKHYAGKVSVLRGEELVNALDECGDESYWTMNKNPQHRNIYRSEREKVVKTIKQLALEHPETDLKGLIKIQGPKSLYGLIHEQVDVLVKLCSYVRENVEDEDVREEFSKVVDEYIQKILGFSDTFFKRKDFIEAIEAIECDEHDKKVILSIVEEIPTSANSADSFFVKYSKENRSNYEIARNLVYESRPTAEHIICASKEGENDTENYICDCACCNSVRSDTPFDVWAENIPNFSKNLEEYFQRVQEAYLGGELGQAYENYTENMIEKIENITGGKVKINPPKIDEERRQELLAAKKEIQEQKRQRVTLSLGKNIEKTIKKIESLQARLEKETNPEIREQLQESISAKQEQLMCMQEKIAVLTN